MKCGNKFVASWFEFNLTINNILVALTARKYKWDVACNIVGDTEICEALRTSGARDFGLSGEVDFLDQLVKISEITELVEREKSWMLCGGTGWKMLSSSIISLSNVFLLFC